MNSRDLMRAVMRREPTERIPVMPQICHDLPVRPLRRGLPVPDARDEMMVSMQRSARHPNTRRRASWSSLTSSVLDFESAIEEQWKN